MNPPVALIFLSSTALLAARSPLQEERIGTLTLAQAAACFAELEAACELDGGKLWGVPIAGPVLLVDPATRKVVANQADEEGRLEERSSVFVGTLPADQPIANAPVEWAGVRWAMVVVLFLGATGEERVSLLAHESFHRVQPGLGLYAFGEENVHLDTLEGRVWMQLEWNALEAFPGNNTSGETATFQLVLSPSPVADTVRFNYGSSTSGSDPWSATIGVEGVGGVQGYDPSGSGASNSYFPWGSFSTVELTPNSVPLPSTFGGWVAAYNLGDQGIYNYDTQGPGGSVANTGALVMPTGIPLGTKDLTFSFDYMKETEGGGTATFDQCFVEVRRTFPAGQPWLPLGSTAMPIPGNSACPSVTTITETAANPLSPLSPLLGDGGAVRFRFNTVNAIANAFPGWYVGNGGLQGGPVAFFQRYGVGCAPAGAPLPRIGSSGAPLSPSVMAIELDDAPPSAPLALLINASLGMPLPTPLVAFGLPAASPACNFEIGLFPFPMIVPAVSNPAGGASIPVAIPPGISGEVFAQWACVTPSATFSMSDGAIFAVR